MNESGVNARVGIESLVSIRTNTVYIWFCIKEHVSLIAVGIKLANYKRQIQEKFFPNLTSRPVEC